VVEALALSEKYGNDAFRYFLMREMTFGLDASFTEEAFVGRLNADLANDLGNLVSRATTMIVSFGGGALPAAAADGSALAAELERTREDVDVAMASFAFQRALGAIWSFIGLVNRHVDATQPWALAKDPAQRGRLDAVLWELGESLRCLGILLDPFVPDAAARIRAAVSAPAPRLEDARFGRGAAGAPVQKLGGLFPRVDTKPADTLSPEGRGQGDLGKISIDAFRQVELRVAEVLAAEKVAKSKKLLKLTIRVGEETRTLVAGVAEHYAPDALVGRKVVIVANLQPATLMGVESNGMVLAAEHDGTLALLTLDKDVPSGAKVK
jgi:methionyl-tRNA synthetase